MRNYLEKRLETLIGEQVNGQTTLKNLDSQRTQLQETMLRISGAIQVVQEALRDVPAVPSDTLEAKATEPDVHRLSNPFAQPDR